MTALELMACAILVSVSGFLSASEVALFSLSRFQLRALKEQLRPAYRKIKRLLADPGGLLIVILVTNEIVNVSVSTIITHAIARAWTESSAGGEGLFGFLHGRLFPHAPDWAIQTALGILFTTPILLFICEITPKSIAARANQIVAPLSAGPLSLIYDVLLPVRYVLKKFLALVSRLLGQEPVKPPEPGTQPLLKAEEFLSMVEEGHREGAIHESELELIRNVFEMDDTRVSDIYTPLTQVHSVALNTPLKTALASMRGQRYSRIPVTGASRKQVVGVLYSKDLLYTRLEQDSTQANVADLMRKPFVVPPQLRLNALFRKFKQQRIHLAVVESAPGEAVGIVTMADVLDALLEDILPEDEAEGA